MTPRDLLAWCLHSPRRFVTVVAALALGVASSFWALSNGTGASSQDMRGEAAVSRSVDNEGGNAKVAPASSHEPDERPARWSAVRSATRAFLDAYLAERSADRDRVDPGLERWVTPTLWRGLRFTDPANLPSRHVESIENVETGAFASEVAASLGQHQVLRLELVIWDGGWRVSDVRVGEAS